MVDVHPVTDRLGEALQFASGLTRLVLAGFRSLALALDLLHVLWTIPRPATVLVQNPPTVPTLVIAYLAARLRRSRLVIDWHNIGHEMAAARLGGRGVLSALVRWQERFLGRRADAHLAVSQALKERLRPSSRICGDAPAGPAALGPPATALRARHELLECVTGSPVRTEQVVIVSSTSWSFDEDFDLLLQALDRYDAATAKPDAPYGRTRLPPLVVIVWGVARGGGLRGEPGHALLPGRDGPDHLGFRRRLSAVARGRRPGRLLHRSTSGCDLPMKVVDMLASCLPVLAFDYGPCLREQLDPGRNSLFFDSAASLAHRLVDTLAGFPEDATVLTRLRSAVAAQPRRSWDDAYRQVALPLLAWISSPGSSGTGRMSMGFVCGGWHGCWRARSGEPSRSPPAASWDDWWSPTAASICRPKRATCPSYRNPWTFTTGISLQPLSR